jgi:CheY-like chemotaxis protein
METARSLRSLAPLALVVEDDPVIADVLQVVLELAGYRVLTTPQGKAAIRLAAEEQPDLMTLDLHLTDVDGYSVLAAIRRTDGTPVIPVIILSGEPYRPGATDGVVAVLAKPFELADFEQAVQTALALPRTDRTLGLEVAA